MKKFLTMVGAICLFVLSLGSVVFGDEYVRGYFRRDGTYVQPHWRSSPDGNPYNNYNYPGNVNPYTGERATGNPDSYLRRYYDSNPYQSPYRDQNPYRGYRR